MRHVESPAIAIDRSLASGDARGALAIADAEVAKSRRSFAGWLGRVRAKLQLGWIAEADADLDELLRLAPGDPQVLLLAGILAQRLGRVDRGIESLTRVLLGGSPYAGEAAVALGETYWFAGRVDEAEAHLARVAAHAADPRLALLRARLLSKRDRPAAIDALRALAAGERSPVLRRAAGFEAVGLLDREGRYREAFDLTAATHADTTARFDLEGLLLDLAEQRPLLAKRERWAAPRVEPVDDVVLVVGLPRSGTTLLEQMLDWHPEIGGIGEYDGVAILGGEMTALGAWPRRVAMLGPQALAPMRDRYLRGARHLRRDGARLAFDKTLRAWRWLPAVAAALPGTRAIHLARDPRDAAISTFLSYFHPFEDGWTGSLRSIRRVAEAERALLPEALDALALPHQALVYENLVADPAAHATRILDWLGLAHDARVLAPEANARAVFTLSHEQVRQPIHRGSVGRWRNYAFAFEADDAKAWADLGAAHDARRTQG